MGKLVIRDIRGSFGRWAAIFAIVALGTGFLAGLLQTCPAMLGTVGAYVRDTAMYDWHAVLPDGVGAELLAEARSSRGIRAAEAAAEADTLADSVLGGGEVFRFRSVTQNVNRLSVRAGRLPERPDECFADNACFTEADLGTVVRISEKNDARTRGRFACESYTVVGVGTSPLYINYERGATSLGSGTVRAFLFIPRDGFADVQDTDLFLALDTDAPACSEDYDRVLRLTKRRLLRFADEYFAGDPGSAYLLSRNDDPGFSGFRSDAEIVAGIARVFPLFFYLVAALVCAATMTRMADEQRARSGMLSALGFGTERIVGGYLLYSGSAALSGGAVGFFLGTAAIPRMIWRAYNVMYRLEGLTYRPDFALGALLTAGFLGVCLLSTALSALRVLRGAPAQLLRPPPPRAGRRLPIERVPGLRRRLGLLRTAALRSVLRDRARLLPAVVSVAGCTALLLAAFGVRDSMGGIVAAQFEEVSPYDFLVVLPHEPDAAALRAFDEGPGRLLEKRQLMYQDSMTLVGADAVKSVTVAAASPGELDGLLDFHRGGAPLPFPAPGEALLCAKLAETFALSAGDRVLLRSADGKRLSLTVSGVFDNYFHNFVVINAESLEAQWGEKPERRMLLACTAPDADVRQTAAELLGWDGAVTVFVMADTAARVAQMLRVLDFIVLLVLVCSGALAFIVLYDLAGISILERLREIATVRVLGFSPRETAAYVFRENALLTLLGALLGLPLGQALHRFTMDRIRVELLWFAPRITPASYLLSLLFTLLFSGLVDFLLYFRIDRIRMAEALQTAE